MGKVEVLGTGVSGLVVKNDKIQKLGVKTKSFEEGLEEIEKQLEIRN